jgi:hypothetical protein
MDRNEKNQGAPQERPNPNQPHRDPSQGDNPGEYQNPAVPGGRKTPGSHQGNVPNSGSREKKDAGRESGRQPK